MTGTTRTGVSGTFTASHRSFEGQPHTHRWHVLAWFAPRSRQDARTYRANLDRVLHAWEGRELPPHLQEGEDIAAWIGRMVGCVEVQVSRPDERIHARWMAA